MAKAPPSPKLTNGRNRSSYLHLYEFQSALVPQPSPSASSLFGFQCSVIPTGLDRLLEESILLPPPLHGKECGSDRWEKGCKCWLCAKSAEVCGNKRESPFAVRTFCRLSGIENPDLVGTVNFELPTADQHVRLVFALSVSGCARRASLCRRIGRKASCRSALWLGRPGKSPSRLGSPHCQ